MPKHKVGDPRSGEIVGRQNCGSDSQSRPQTTDGVRLQVSFASETALIY
jgi:hypothetical protein